jgi:hypothetical protein
MRMTAAVREVNLPPAPTRANRGFHRVFGAPSVLSDFMAIEIEPGKTPVYLVRDGEGRKLSVHLTTQGAKTALEFLAAAESIAETTLER